jgi:hypothetical protein
MLRSHRTHGAMPVALAWLALLWVAPAYAHIGSPDVYAEGDAGPYKLLVTVRPPRSIPGAAEIEVRTSPSQIDQIRAELMPLTGEASPRPAADGRMQQSSGDHNFFSGNLRILSPGSWQVRFLVTGSQGQGEFAVPVAAADASKNIPRPLVMRVTLNAGNVLDLHLTDPAMHSRGIKDLIPDHGHRMQLFLVREPRLDFLLHLYPKLAGAGDFRQKLPSMPGGEYRLYADVVHADGHPETLVSTALLPAIFGQPLDDDGAQEVAPPLGQGNENRTSFRLPDGYGMVWARPPVLRAHSAQVFRFYLFDPKGRPPEDMALDMGVLGHAVFLKSDGAVFAHLYPFGTPALAAMRLAEEGSAARSAAPRHLSRGTGPLPNHVGFPYGFPTPGKYRIFVEMKHGSTIETGSFDASVSP